MELLQPDDSSEALELEAAHPSALPSWGGTDVMVDVNFGRARPEAILDLTRVRALAEWEERDGVLRIGAGVSYTTAISDLGDRLPGLAAPARTGGRAGDGRRAADPHPRRDRRHSRPLLPRRRRAPAAVRERGDRRAGLHA